MHGILRIICGHSPICFASVAPSSILTSVATLLACDSLRNLRQLHLWGCAVGNDVAHVIAAWPGAAQLGELILDNGTLMLDEGKLTSSGAATLAEAPLLHNLRGLSLSGNGVTSAGALALASSSVLRNLLVLHLDDNQIERAGAVALARSKSWPHLRFLDLSNNAFFEEDAELLARSSRTADPHLALSNRSWKLPPKAGLRLSAGPVDLRYGDRRSYFPRLPPG